MSVDFKLFGNFLSLREFLFISIGLAIAWFFWFMGQKSVIPMFFAIPISFVIGGGGILMGLVPINEQSLDKWIMFYFAAIRKPTQRVWKKIGYQPNVATSDSIVVSKDHVIEPITQPHGVFISAPLTKNALPQAESSVIAVENSVKTDLQQIEESFALLGQSTTSVITSAQPVTTQTREPVSTMPQPPSPDSYTLASSSQFASVISQENPVRGPISGTIQLSAQSTSKPTLGMSGSSQAVQLSEGSFPPGVTVIPPIQQGTPTVNPQSVAPSQPAPVIQPDPLPKQEPQATVLVIDDNSISDFATTIPGLEEKPNTINIVVKDGNGLILPGVVCVIKNAHGDPVRAAISNILGQILNNIPLKDGMYKVTLTKQGYAFSEITRTLAGKLYPTIEIKSH